MYWTMCWTIECVERTLPRVTTLIESVHTVPWACERRSVRTRRACERMIISAQAQRRAARRDSSVSEDGRESVCVRTKMCVYKCICVHVLSEPSTNEKMRPCASRHTLTCHKHAHALLMTGNSWVGGIATGAQSVLTRWSSQLKSHHTKP